MEYVSFGSTVKADLSDSTQYSTIYTNTVLHGVAKDMPVATLERRRVLDRTAPAWTLYDRDGQILYQWRFSPSSYQSLIDTTARVLAKGLFA